MFVIVMQISKLNSDNYVKMILLDASFIICDFPDSKPITWGMVDR